MKFNLLPSGKNLGLRVFWNRVLRGMFEVERMSRTRRKYYTEDLHNQYSSLNSFSYQLKDGESGGTCKMHGVYEEFMQSFGPRT
jgi:hypothetical protein